jgi:hypothetical protein
LIEAQLALATIGREYHLARPDDGDGDGDPPRLVDMTTRMDPGTAFRVVER